MKWIINQEGGVELAFWKLWLLVIS